MSHMQREVTSPEAAHSPLILKLVEATLGEGPVDPALLAIVRDPALAEARAKAEQQLRELDWPNLGRYQASNAAIVASGVRPGIVFMGDSVTEAWPVADPGLFINGRICRGIAGQTSPQMLLRFQPDVVALKPRAVHLLGGVNDIAGNTGPTTPYRVQCNLLAMVELAQANGIQVLLGLLPATSSIPWRTGFDPAPWIDELNAWAREFAAARGVTLVDYNAALSSAAGTAPAPVTNDGIHPNRRGYAAMRQALEPALAAMSL